MSDPTITITIINDRDQPLPRFLFKFASPLSVFTFIMPTGVAAAEWGILAASAEEKTDYDVSWGADCKISVHGDETLFVASGEHKEVFQSSFAVPAAASIDLFKRAQEETLKWTGA